MLNENFDYFITLAVALALTLKYIYYDNDVDQQIDSLPSPQSLDVGELSFYSVEWFAILCVCLCIHGLILQVDYATYQRIHTAGSASYNFNLPTIN